MLRYISNITIKLENIILIIDADIQSHHCHQIHKEPTGCISKSQIDAPKGRVNIYTIQNEKTNHILFTLYNI